jgi:hypothetical protein
MVSDKAQTCPHCGAPIALLIAPEIVECSSMDKTMAPPTEATSIVDKTLCSVNDTTKDNKYKIQHTFVLIAKEVVQVAVFIVLSLILLGFCTEIAAGLISRHTELAAVIGISTTPFYFVLPTEWILRKFHSHKIVRTVGNILLCIIGALAIFTLLGAASDRALFANSTAPAIFVIEDIIPCIFYSAGLAFVRHRRVMTGVAFDVSINKK